jgi:AraC-like DNA-binding protein
MEIASVKLTAREEDVLRNVDRKRELLRDRTVGVARGRQTGVLVHGVGGTGKSHLVLQELKQMGVSHQLWNSHMTGRTLFDRLGEHPDDVHILDDVEQLMHDKAALGVLRSALWGNERDRDGRILRRITWNAHGRSAEVRFRGGVIMLANRHPGELPEIKAMLTRISAVEYGLTFEEMAAEMHRLALAGYAVDGYRLDSAECVEVMHFVVEECRRLHRLLDLRLLFNSFEDRLQYEQFESGCHWRDLVASRICGYPSITAPIEGKQARRGARKKELDLARELMTLPREERLKTWAEETGKSEPTLYRRLAELGEMDSTG